MRFSVLASYLERLEGISSRIEMTKVLAELFSKTGPEDARLVAYLTQGRLGPAYSAPDFGVAEKMMLKALGEEAVKVFREVGDLGKTVQRLKEGEGDSGVGVGEVHEKLVEIAQAEGEGSQEKKQMLIRELLGRLDGTSAKYVVKVILGKLRAGFSDMTVLDSLSWMVTGDKGLRPQIEEMYNVRADLGEIAETLVRYRKPRKMRPELGTPILMARAERAVSAEEIWERNGACALEYKLDGLRIQAHVSRAGVKLFSRGLEDVTEMYPDVAEGLAKLVSDGCVVEGEMIAVGEQGRFLPFQETVQRKRKYNVLEMAGKIPLTVYLFDLLVLKGESVMNRENYWRRKKLEEMLGSAQGVVRLMPRVEGKSVEDIKKFFRKAVEEGCEGIIAKKLEGVYQAGARDFNWIKYKRSYDKSAVSDTIDAVVMGYDAGQGKRAGLGIGDFLIGVYDSTGDKYFTVAKIGTGLTDDEWRRMKEEIDRIREKGKPENYEVRKEMAVDVWAKPKVVVEVKADEITKSPTHSSGYALRFPRLVSWREKKPEDATSLRELHKMFKMQGRGEFWDS